MLEFIISNWISIIGASIGLLYLYLEYKANIWMWAASIGMAAFYIFIFYSTQLYASMGIYIYFFLASIYGWTMWQVKGKNAAGEEIILRAPRKIALPVCVAVVIVFIPIYFILISTSENLQSITIGDALTTSLNIVALWMISRKWAEQWLLVIPANLISSILLFAQHDVMSGVMFAIYFVVSIFGYFKWKRMAS